MPKTTYTKAFIFLAISLCLSATLKGTEDDIIRNIAERFVRQIEERDTNAIFQSYPMTNEFRAAVPNASTVVRWATEIDRIFGRLGDVISYEIVEREANFRSVYLYFQGSRRPARIWVTFQDNAVAGIHLNVWTGGNGERENASAPQNVADGVLRPIDVMQLHMRWVNDTKNYRGRIENYDLSGGLEITSEIFVDYEVALNVRRCTPTFGTRSIRSISTPSFHETRIDGYGFFQARGRSSFDPFGDGEQDLFVWGRSAQNIMERLGRIATHIRAIRGTGERAGTYALSFRYNDFFIGEYRKLLNQIWENSENDREREMQLLNDFGEQQYWFDATSGELVEYVVLRNAQAAMVPGVPDILFFRKFSVEERNVSYERSSEIINSLFGRREGQQFDSREELLRDFHINSLLAERNRTRPFVIILVNLGVILAILLIRWYHLKNKRTG